MHISLRLFIGILVVVLAKKSFGQNEFFFNHYMFNPTYYNPAWVGTEDQAFLAAHHRSQWAGYDASLDPEGAPLTQLVSLAVPVQGKISGFGLSVSNDQIGPLNSVQARLAISAKKQFRSRELAIGIMPALNTASLNPNYRFNDQGDTSIPQGAQSQIRPNLHAGIFYTTRKNLFIGASVENLLEPQFDFGADAENTLSTNYLLMIGRELGFTRDLTLKPTMLIRSDFNTLTYELSVIGTYQEKMWAGLAFRRSESLSVLLGYSFLENNKLKAGYSFDYVIEDQEAKEPTSHEIFLRYDLPGLIFGGKKAVKTPRFTF